MKRFKRGKGRRMQQRSLLNLLTIPAVGTLVAAGIALAQSGGDGMAPQPQGSPTAVPSPGRTPTSRPGQNAERTVYQAPLNALNSSVSQATARATIVVDGENAGIFIQGTGFSPQTLQMQQVYEGTSCPTQSNDTNGDGFIDAVEATAATGPAALPLTLDLSQTLESGGSTNYPTTSQSGGLTYIASVPLSALQSALGSQPGASPTASPTASPGNGGDGNVIEGRVIQIQGVGSSTQLPNTVEALPDSTANASLPVACGVITRVSE